MRARHAYRPIFVVLVAWGLGSCTPAQHVAKGPVAAPQTVDVPSWPGVDSTVARAADTLGKAALISAQAQAEHTKAMESAFDLAQLADSLLGAAVFRASSDSLQEQKGTPRDATAAYNEGAEALNEFSAASDSAQAATLLERAATRFREALQADPHDTDALYWLARVYEIQADAFSKAGSLQDALGVLQKLVALQGHREDYVALLAEAHERFGTRDGGLAAGTLWARAAQLAIDDAALDPDGLVQVDSSLVFAHYARSSRAFVQARRGTLAQRALGRAVDYVTSTEDSLFVASEQSWLTWDGGNLDSRLRFDSLLTLGEEAPGQAADGLQELLANTQSEAARLDVQHELALHWYRTDQWEEAIGMLSSVFQRAQELGVLSGERMARIREDYGTVAFNVAMAQRARGELRAALGYLLQSEATGFSQSARAALEVSRLLTNDIEAAIDAGLRAEAQMAGLLLEDQQALLRHLVELYRRAGDREQAAEYVAKYRRLGVGTGDSH